MESTRWLRQKITHHEKLRFIYVGIFNTIFDTSLYTLLVYGSLGILPASYVSSSCAVVISYALHQRFTFKVKFGTLKSFGQFLAVTLCGVWILQPLIIYGVDQLLSRSLVSLPRFISIILPKLCAIGVLVFWNYLWYSRLVFKRKIDLVTVD